MRKLNYFRSYAAALVKLRLADKSAFHGFVSLLMHFPSSYAHNNNSFICHCNFQQKRKRATEPSPYSLIRNTIPVQLQIPSYPLPSKMAADVDNEDK